MADVNIYRPLGHLAGQEVQTTKAYIDAIASPQTVSWLDARDFSGLGSDTIYNTTTKLQAAVDYARVHGMCLQLPRGIIDLEDTLKLGYGDVNDLTYTFDTCRIRGQASIDPARGTYIRSNHIDRPAINVQISPFLTVEDLFLQGLNNVSAAVAPYPRRDRDFYYRADLGIEFKRYTPYAGITVNAYSGNDVPPENRYPNDPYGRGSGGGIYFKNLNVSQFEVGYCMNPNGGGGGLGSDVTIEGGLTQLCAYCFAFCDPNGRNVNLVDTQCGNCWCVVTNCAYGARAGIPPSIRGGEWNNCYRWIDMTAIIGGMEISGVSGETMHQFGRWGGSGSACPLDVRGCSFYLGAGGGADQGKESVFFTGSGAVKINATIAPLVDANYNVISHLGDDGTTYTGAYFLHSTPFARDWAVAVRTPSAAGLVRFDGAQFNNSAANNDARGMTTSTSSVVENITLGNRACIKPGTSLVNVVAASFAVGTKQLKVDPACPGFVQSSPISGPGWNDITRQVTFFTGTPGETLPGDVLLWRLKSDSPSLYTSDGGSVINCNIPLLLVVQTDNTGLTVCQAIFNWDDIDQAYNPGVAQIVADMWAPGIGYNGTTPGTVFRGTWIDADNTITADFADSVVRVGDFIRAANGLPDLVRVTAVAGDTITLSKDTIAAATDEPLYFGKFTEL